MSLQFGGTPIGAMQYGGTPISEAMMDGVIVWRAIITVTPAAPTFLASDPWYTLPTVEGVTYTVSGTPGAGNTATITATPVSQYYILSGQTVWSKTWAASGSWGPVVVNGTTPRLMDSFTVTAGGQYTISHTVGWGAMIRTPAGTVDGVGSFPSVATVTVILAAGNVVEFMVRPDGFAQESGSWSVIKN